MFGVNEIQINREQEKALIGLLEERATQARLNAGNETNAVIRFGIGSWQLKKLLEDNGFEVNSVDDRFTQRPTWNFAGIASEFIEVLSLIRSDHTVEAGTKRSATVALNKIFEQVESHRCRAETAASNNAFAPLFGGNGIFGGNGVQNLVRQHNDIVSGMRFLNENDWSFVAVDGHIVRIEVGGHKVALVSPKPVIDDNEMRVEWAVIPANDWETPFMVISQRVSHNFGWNHPIVTISDAREILAVTKATFAKEAETFLSQTDENLVLLIEQIKDEFGIALEIVSPQVAVA